MLKNTSNKRKLIVGTLRRVDASTSGRMGFHQASR